MPKPESNALTLLAVLIVGALAGRMDSWTSILTGLVLLVILFAYDSSARERTFWQSVGFAAVCGFCLILVLGLPLHYFGLGWIPNWQVIVWVAGTVIFLIIDRARIAGPAPLYQPTPQPTSPAVSPPTQAEPKATPPANAIPLPLGAGKPATIYLNLVGEGLVCLRPVQAEQMGKDFYRIVEPVPEGEAWEYQPGQIVRCQKKNLSSGKALVAIEEAPRAR